MEEISKIKNINKTLAEQILRIKTLNKSNPDSKVLWLLKEILWIPQHQVVFHLIQALDLLKKL